MRQLTPFQNLVFQVGGLLLIVGAILPMVPPLAGYAAHVFTSGALMFAPMQLLQRYEGRSLTIRRLRRQQIIGAFLLLIAACLLLMKTFRLGRVYGEEWKLVLVIAAVLQLYTAFRIPHELKKEEEA